MAGLGIWSRFQSILFGGAIGAASRDAIAPALEPAKQHAWSMNQVRVLDPGLLARLAATGGTDEGTAAAEATRSGYNGSHFAALTYLAQTVPDVAEALTLWRRGLIPDADFTYTLTKHGLDARYVEPIIATKAALLSPAEIANAVQQGHMPDDGLLPAPAGGALPLTIPLTQIQVDPVTEAAGHGLTVDRLRIIANLAGLPPADVELLQMWNRGIIDEASVDAGIREGHRKTKWIPAVKQLRYAVLSAQEYASARLRTWVTAEESYAGGALTGHTKEQMDLLFLNRGRPASPVQMWTGWARGVIGPRGVPVAYEDHAKAIAISDIRPEYAEMLWAIRFVYPSLFQLRGAVESKALTPERALTILRYQRYEDQDAAALVKSWQSGGSAATKAETKAELRAEYEGLHITRAELLTALEQLGFDAATAAAEADLGDDARVRKARDQVVEAAHKSYLIAQLTDAEALAGLEAAGVVPEAAAHLLATWKLEASLTHKTLTASQIRAAYRKALIPAAEALTMLEDLHYTADAANTYLLS